MTNFQAMTQLSKTERQEIQYHHDRGHGPTAIGRMIERDKSVISREIHRNKVNGKYIAKKAHLKRYQRRYWIAKETPRLWDRSWWGFRRFLDCA
jgi:IS30 family transposase